MPAKKAAKKEATEKAAKKAPAKKAAKKATKAAAAEGSKSPAAPKKTPDVAKAAYLNYRSRVEKGLPGDHVGDWLAAEKSPDV